MRAVQCNSWGLPELLRVASVPDLIPGPGEVLIDVHAAGVNFPDTLIIQKKYQFQPAFPFSPGGEVAGFVKALGPCVEGFSIGERVAGGASWGGFAEQALIKAERVTPIPDDMDFNTASAFLLAYGTSFHGLHDRAKLQPGETLLILGASGGVGTAAIEIGKAMGAKVIAAASSEEKVRYCLAKGADLGINYTNDDFRSQLATMTDAVGPNVILDSVGGSISEAAFRSIAWEGRHLVVGFAAGAVPTIPLNLPLLKGSAILGVFIGGHIRRSKETAQAHLRDLFQLYSSGKIHPVVERTYRLEEAPLALQHIMERRVMGKIIVLPRE